MTFNRWLQAGVVAAGMGAALVGGAGVACASPDDESTADARSTAGATDQSPTTRKAPRFGGARSAAVAVPSARVKNRAAAAAAVRPATAARAAVPAIAPVAGAASLQTNVDVAQPVSNTASVAAPSPTVHAARTLGTVPVPAAAAAMTSAPAASATAALSIGDWPPGPIMAGLIAAQAYIYGYPLMEYERVRAAAPTLNTMINLTTFANPDVAPIWQAIGGGKRPNTDTFYSVAELDLSNGPVVLTIPDMGTRYFSFQLTDPYTNVTGYIGSRTTGSPVGGASYAITWTGGPDLPLPAEFADATVVEVPYASMMVLGRTLAGNIADQESARQLIAQYQLTPLGATSPNNAILPAGPSGIDYLDGISNAMTQNPPPAEDADILAKMARIGVGVGLQVADANLGILSKIAVDVAVQITAAILPALAQLQQGVSAIQHKGWAIPNANIGDFGTDYLFRAGVAEVGLVANTQDEAMYQAGLLDSCYLPLNGFLGSSYTLHFAAGELPPAEAFWSVTVYDASGGLVPNAEGHFSVSSSRPEELVYEPDGSLTIIFSQTDPADPNANWLVIPAGGFSAYLRMYVPEQAALDRTWLPPAIHRRSLFGIVF